MGRSLVQLTPPVVENLACPSHVATNALDHEADIAKVQGWLGHANRHHATLRAFELIMIRWTIGEWKESGYALRGLEGKVYYMNYGTKKNAEFTNRR